MQSRYKLICFDMDGTLIDSMGYWRMCNVQFLLRHHLPMDPEIMRDALFQSNRVMVPRYIEHYQLDMDVEEIYREYETMMLDHYERDIEPKPGALKYLISLKRQGVRICVATATPRRIAERALSKYGLMPYIEFVTDPYELGETKAHPAFFHRLAEKAGVDVDEIAMFEDALYAMKGAKAAGCGVYAIEDAAAYRDAQAIREIADVYVHSFLEMV